MSPAVESENTTVGPVTAPRRRTLDFNDRSILALKPKTKLTDYWEPVAAWLRHPCRAELQRCFGQRC